MATTDEIETLFNDTYEPMIRLALFYVHDPERAKDIVQDVFASLLADGDPGRITSAYVSTSVRNKCLTFLRDLSIRERITNLYILDLDKAEQEDWPGEDTLEYIRHIADIHLSQQCRKVLELRYFEGMSYQEASESLGISKVAVYKHLRKAIDTIKLKLKEYGQD